MSHAFTSCSAAGELQRVAPDLLHLFPAPRRLLRAQHVRRRRGGEFPPVQGRAGERGEGCEGGQEGEET